LRENFNVRMKSKNYERRKEGHENERSEGTAT
jgi:hypothetical protein